MIKLMAMESYFMLIKMYMKENGLMIRLMGKEYILMLMEPDIMENGKKINNMGVELNHGLMELFMRVSTMMVRRMEKVN